MRNVYAEVSGLAERPEQTRLPPAPVNRHAGPPAGGPQHAQPVRRDKVLHELCRQLEPCQNLDLDLKWP